MTITRLLLTCGAAAMSISSTAALARTPASPQDGTGYGTSPSQKKQRRQEVGDRTELSDGRYVVAGLGTIAVLGGIIVAISNNDDDNDDSPGG